MIFQSENLSMILWKNLVLNKQDVSEAVNNFTLTTSKALGGDSDAVTHKDTP